MADPSRRSFDNAKAALDAGEYDFAIRLCDLRLKRGASAAASYYKGLALLSKAALPGLLAGVLAEAERAARPAAEAAPPAPSGPPKCPDCGGNEAVFKRPGADEGSWLCAKCPRVLEGGPLASEDYEAAVAGLKGFGKLDGCRLMGWRAEARIPFLTALMEAGEEKRALGMLLEEQRRPFQAEDYALGLWLCHRLEDYKAADKIFDEVQDAIALMEAPQVYYAYAVICERRGRIAAAVELYRKLQKRVPGFQDAAERLKACSTLTSKETTRLATAADAAEGASAPTKTSPSELIAGKFELRGTLGAGGMGDVFKAWDVSLSREVALKSIKEARAMDAKARRLFMEEAKLVASLNHSFIVMIHEIATEGEEIFLVFQYLDGETLNQRLERRERLSPKEVARAMAFVSDALAYAHSRGVIHRDLKPANIMIERQGHVKVLDFGIAGRVKEQLAQDDSSGTPAYMAPEQHRGKSSPLSDVFSLGASMYELLTGRLPFPGPDFAAQKAAEQYAPLPAEIPEDLRDLVASCLRAAPEARPQSMAELSGQFRALAARFG